MCTYKLREVTSSNIQEKISQTRKEIFELKFKQATEKNIKPHLIKHKKHLLAQLLTMQTELYKS